MKDYKSGDGNMHQSLISIPLLQATALNLIK